MKSFREYGAIEEAAEAGLDAKAEKSGISIETLRKVYRRGVAAWNSGHRPGTTPQQWGMARVNSYITKGKGTWGGADKDLHESNLAESGGEVVWKDGNNHIEKYSDDAFALYVNGKKSKFFTSVELAKNSIKSDVVEAAVPKDKESGLPKKYVAGLSASTAKARAAHFDKADKLSDRDPEAYKPAPGDATAKTKESKHTKKYREIFGENMDEEIHEACWVGYKQVGMKKKGDKMVPNCVPESGVKEATYQGKEVSLNKPMAGDIKKSKVYVDPDGDGKAQKVNFGDKNMSIKKDQPARKKSYCARSSGQGNLTDKSSANYWSRRAWDC